MKYTLNPRFNKKISRVGFGGWQLGNSTDFAAMSMEEGIELVSKAVESGITLFDTSPNYAKGKSEEILGKALKGTQEQVFINTKVGHNRKGETDFSLDGIARSVDESLKALNREYLDSVILHNPGMDILRGETDHYQYLQNIKKKGLIRGYGVSIDTAEEVREVLDHSDVDVIELMFNIMHQSPEVWFEEIKKRDILLIIKVPLDSGWLTGKYHKESTFDGIRARWSQEEINTRAALIKKIKNIVGHDDLVQPALSFILSFGAVSSVIPGIRNMQQLQMNTDAAHYSLDKTVKQELEELYDDEIAALDLPW